MLCHCQAFNRAEYARLRDGGSVNTGDDAGETSVPRSEGGVICGSPWLDGGPGCTLAVPPPSPPSTPNVPGTGTRIYAAHSIRFGPGGEWRTIGIDRDGVCTAGGVGPVSCMSGLIPVADGDYGRDNTFSSVIGISAVVTRSFDEARLNRGLIKGNGNFALRIQDFGGDNDGYISVQWLPLANGHRTTPPGPDGSLEPVWDGHDRWAIDRRAAYQADGTTPLLTGEAYTTCGQFVMNFPMGGGIRINNNDTIATLHITNMVGVGRFTADNKLILDLSGVWARDTILSDLRGFGVCPPPQTSITDWTRLQQAIGASLDILGTLRSAPNTPCNAMSIAFRAEFWPIELDPDADIPANNNDPCADAGVPPG